MEKVGIITHYHNSTNYGGVFQSYALTKFLLESGFDAKQINYNNFINPEDNFFKKCKKILLGNIQFLFKENRIPISTMISFYKFRKNIPHTRVFNHKSIKKLENKFDIFITGSDQVWNPAVISPAYCLDFASSKKIKMSYAASISSKKISEFFLKRLLTSLQSFNYISVREETSLNILKDADNNINVELCLDPVFLIEADKWCEYFKLDKFKLKGQKFIFAYFLSNSNGLTQLEEFCDINSLNAFVVSRGHKKSNSHWLHFINPGPVEFLKYIYNSSMVFTDSFHGVAFSELFCKEFFVFERHNLEDMNERIINILNLCNDSNHFYRRSYGDFNRYCTLNHNLNSNKIKFKKIKDSSLKFLNALKNGNKS